MAAPNFSNRTLYHGDNLPVLRGMNSGTVDLIATDPPFNKGKDFHATPDSLAAGAKFQDRWSWADDVEQAWVDQITDDWPDVMRVITLARAAYGDDMGAFLCFMGVRLLEMRRVLKDTGSLYLHCDPTASHYLKALLDAVFGPNQFRREIIWHLRGAAGFKALAPNWVRGHETLLYYTKSGDRTFNKAWLPYDERQLRRFSSVDEDGRRYKVITKTRRLYLDEAKGVPATSVWSDVASFQTVVNSAERTGYPTQKPLALYERIIQASSNEGDLVLDPFAGCATTPIAAERLGRQWVGIDLWDGSLGIVQRRLQDNRQLLTDIPIIHYETDPPVRTDGGEEAAPFIQVTERYAEPEGPRMSRAEMYDHLLAQHGQRCQGCDRTFDDPRYLDLDHNTPRSDGGWNHITNRVLLCGPCNRAKSNTYTLSGLRRLNAKNGWMAAS